MPLTDTILRNTKPGPKARKLFDGGGLYLLVRPEGSPLWRIKYYYEGVERMHAVGVYPDVTLKRAREILRELRDLLARGIDPAAERKATKRARANTFEAVAREWCEKQKSRWSEEYASAVMTRFEQDVFPVIGSKPVRGIAAADFLDCLQRLEKRGVLETAHKVKGKCSEVMRFAVATRRADRDPVVDLRGALPPVKTQHYPSITDPKQVGELLRAIEGYRGNVRTVNAALRLLPYVFLRSSELRLGEWREIEWDDAQWRVPADRMKTKLPHIVPLARQALAILRDLYLFTGPEGLIFPGVRSATRPISENTVNAALRRIGYTADEMTGHGFRSLASTLLNEQGRWDSDAIERQLAHSEENGVRAAYNYAQYLPERRKVMQVWADYLDDLRADRNAAAASSDTTRKRRPRSSRMHVQRAA